MAEQRELADAIGRMNPKQALAAAADQAKRREGIAKVRQEATGSSRFRASVRTSRPRAGGSLLRPGGDRAHCRGVAAELSYPESSRLLPEKACGFSLLAGPQQPHE